MPEYKVFLCGDLLEFNIFCLVRGRPLMTWGAEDIEIKKKFKDPCPEKESKNPSFRRGKLHDYDKKKNQGQTCEE